MKTRFYSLITASITILLLITLSASALAQHEQHGEQKPASQDSKKKDDQHQGHSAQDMAKMMQEPHHVLAMAYHENVATFARALRRNVEQTGGVNAEFARDAVAEIRRSFDLMERHHQEHMNSMKGAEQSQMSSNMKMMEEHHSKIKEILAELERETSVATPDPKRVTAKTTDFLNQLEMMSKMQGGNKKAGVK